MLEYILQITFLLCLLVVFELSVDIPMDTNCAPFPADYSFISMKQTTVKRVAPVVEAKIVSLKKCFSVPTESTRKTILLNVSYK